MESTSLQFEGALVRVDNFGGDFLILRSGDAVALGRIGRAIFEADFDFVEEVVVTKAEVLVQVNGRFHASKLDRLTEVEFAEAEGYRTFELPVWFGGEWDWERVEEETGMERSKVVEELCAGELGVEMLGFLPGFAYLEGLPEHLQVPRKEVPAKYVEAGSLAIGGKYLGLYALDSPGGWQVIGRTPLQLLQIPDLPPVAYFPGDRFRIRPLTQAEFDALLSEPLTLSAYHARS